MHISNANPARDISFAELARQATTTKSVGASTNGDQAMDSTLPFRRFLLVVVTCGVMSICAWSAETSLSTGDSTYVLGPGDRITVQVEDVNEIQAKPVRLDPSGFIDLPLAGRISASGLTSEQLRLAIAAQLKKYVTNPQVSIDIVEYQSRPVSVIGEVNSPGVHQLDGPKRLIEVISLAGGLREDAGAQVIITREAGYGPIPLADARTDVNHRFSTASISLDSLLAAKNPAENILIRPDDVISIPRADVVYVVGDVKKAGGFEMRSHDAMSLLQALSLAEGLGPDAAPQKARILRPTAEDASKVTEIPVDIKQIFAGKAGDMQLYANDVLFVPNSLSKSSARRAAEAVLQAATGVAIYHW
jgi:polysaccharide export outer membrane protein